jgi:hypothetical protein
MTGEINCKLPHDAIGCPAQAEDFAMTLQEFLQDVLDRAREEFPETGVLVIALHPDEAEPVDGSLSVATNMDPEEVDDVLENFDTACLQTDDEVARRLN